MSLKNLDGMSVKDAANMPHPCDLKRWSDTGYYEIDANLGVFRLTAKGRDAISQDDRQSTT